MALENKLGLTSSTDLARAEERISKKAVRNTPSCILKNFFVKRELLHYKYE